MTNFWLLILLAALGGFAVTLQGQLMGTLTERLGTLESVLITYGGGGLAMGLFMLVLKLMGRGDNLAAWRTVPLYTLAPGLLGLLIVGTIGFAASRLGVVMAFTIMLASQFLLAGLVDHFGLLGAPMRPLDMMRVAGVLIALVGVWLVVK
jgi:bacterial/archaeal transporter family-2 protein